MNRPWQTKRTGGRGLRKKPGELNRTEQERADQLEIMKRSGAILDYWFQPFRLRLATDNAYYAPDFMVLYPDGSIEIEEIKGFFEEAALVRIKVAADTFPFAFVSLTKQRKKDGGGWERRVFKGWGDGEPIAPLETSAHAGAARAGGDLFSRVAGGGS